MLSKTCCKRKCLFSSGELQLFMSKFPVRVGSNKIYIYKKKLIVGGGVRNKPLAAYHKKLPLIPNSQKNDVLAQWGAIYAPHASLEKCQLSEFSSI